MRASLVTQLVKNPPVMWETWVRSLGWKDPLEKGIATHSGILAWRIPWTVLSMGSQRLGHFWETFTFTCESWNYKTLRKKIIGVDLCVFWLSVDSYLWRHKWQENRDKLDFIKKLSFLCFKWHHWECEKTTHRMRKIFASNIFAKRFVSKYIYENS